VRAATRQRRSSWNHPALEQLVRDRRGDLVDERRPCRRVVAQEVDGLGGALAGVFVALLFLLTPSAWVSIRGILSEPLYLALSLAALIYHDTRLEAGGGKRELLVFGLLVAAAYLARVAGIPADRRLDREDRQ